jgi:dihydroorotate dehydrogenase (fumarate)/dihydroorotate dehydrogenase
MGVYRHLVRPLLFRCDPEWIHDRGIATAERLGRSRTICRVSERCHRPHPALATTIAGVRFPGPIGLAAGFDKNGRAVDFLATLGFGHVEVGSVSAEPSAGNPRPRLFRLPADEAVVVHYGVPNDGAEAVAARLARRRTPVPVGVNIVETNTGRAASRDEVIGQFVTSVRTVAGVADYLSLNLNCPNTAAGHSVFDDPAAVRDLLAALADLDPRLPVFLKVTATTEPARIESTLAAAEPFRFVAGFSFNVPPGKPDGLRTPAADLSRMPGVVCGRPLREMMEATLRAWVVRADRQRFAFIAGGGIATAEEAYWSIRQGASLVQVYTALIYEGPGLIRRINAGLARRFARDGFTNPADAVGMDVGATCGADATQVWARSERITSNGSTGR